MHTPPLAPRSPSRELARRAELERSIVATGTDNQRARYADNLLPEDELAQLARIHYFAELSFPRWASRDRLHLYYVFPHAKTCEFRGAPMPPDLVVTRAAQTMDANSYAVLERVKQAVEITRLRNATELDGVNVEILEHALKCQTCGRERLAFSAKVTITWAGRPLVREFSLDHEKFERHRITQPPPVK